MNRKETISNRYEILNYVNKGMFITDQELVILFWNKDLEEKTGILYKEIVGNSLIDQFPEFNNESFKKKILSVKKERPLELSFENNDAVFSSVVCKNFQRIFHISLIPSFDKSQEYLLFSLERDETNVSKDKMQKNTSQEIQVLNKEIQQISESKKILERILSTSSEGFFIVDKNNKIVEVNNAMCKILNRKEENILDKQLMGFLDKKNRKILFQELKKRKEGKSSVYEIELLLPDFKSVFCIFHAVPHFDNTGTQIGSFVMVSDITEHRNIENELNNYKKNLEKLVNERSEKLITSEEKYRKLTETLTDGVFTIDLKGNFTYINQACEKITGYLIEDFIGKRFTKILAPEYLGPVLEKFRQAKSGEEFPLYEIELIHKDKRRISVELNVSSIYDYNKNIIGRIGSFRDITKRKETEDGLRENEEKFRSISISAQDAIIIMDNEGNISFWNKAAEKTFNYTYQEAIGKYLHKFITPNKYFMDFSKGFSKFQKTGKGNAVGKTLELSAIKKDGTEFPISLSLSAVKLKGKWNALGIIRDISQIKAAEAEIKRSEQNFKALAKNSFECIAINDIKGNYLYVNAQASELTGYSVEELLSLNVRDLTPVDSVEIVMKRVKDRIEDKTSSKYFESQLLCKNGKIIPIEIAATKTEWHEKPADMVFFHDISVRKQAEEILRQSEERLKIALDIASTGLWELNLQNNELYIGPNIFKLLDYEKDDNSILSLEDLHNPNDWPQIKKQFKLLKEKKISTYEYEYKIKTKTGKWKWFQTWSKISKWDNKGKAVSLLGAVMDIDDTKQSEKKIQHLNAVLQAIRDVDQLITREKNKTILLQEACNVLIKTRGYSSAWIGLLDENKNFTAFADAGFGNSFSTLVELIKNKNQIECVKRALNQSDIIFIDNHTLICEGCPMLGNAPNNNELTIRLEHNNSIYGVLSVSLPNEFVTDKDEQALFKELANDIAFALHNLEIENQRKKAEEKLKKQTIELKERNEELDAFAHSVAHDLKNPLGAVLGFSELLNDEFSDLSEDEIQQFIQHIYKGSTKMKNIIDGLLLLSSLRKTEVKTKVLDMSLIIEEAIDRNSQLIEKNNAEIVFTEKWPKVYGFAPWIEEVWVNYINNAIKYGGEPPKIELGFDIENSNKSVKKMMRFWVRDNGKGISPENQKRLFKQFERLDQVKIEGHGLGLSIVRRIIEKLGGDVGVESHFDSTWVGEEKGSLFYFTLPIENR